MIEEVINWISFYLCHQWSPSDSENTNFGRPVHERRHHAGEDAPDRILHDRGGALYQRAVQDANQHRQEREEARCNVAGDDLRRLLTVRTREDPILCGLRQQDREHDRLDVHELLNNWENVGIVQVLVLPVLI